MSSETKRDIYAAPSMSRRAFAAGTGAGLLALTACSNGTSTAADTMSEEKESVLGQNPDSAESLAISQDSWSYDADNGIYCQIGLPCCADPEADAYESMGIYVPGAYFKGTENEDGTYSCTIDETAKVGSFTATTAPVVIPINTAGYSAQAAPTSYSAQGLTDYLEAGFVYVYPGARGRSNGTNDNGTSFAGDAPYARDASSSNRFSLDMTRQPLRLSPSRSSLHRRENAPSPIWQPIAGTKRMGSSRKPQQKATGSNTLPRPCAAPSKGQSISQIRSKTCSRLGGRSSDLVRTRRKTFFCPALRDIPV